MKSNKLPEGMGYINEYITKENIEIGDYTYYHSTKGDIGLSEFENNNVLYHFPEFYNDKLIIGKFCSIADGVQFFMNGANHDLKSFSQYPFFITGINTPIPVTTSRGDTIIGNDVWIGKDATIMPGITIGDGAIIAAKSVVTKNVPPYTVFAGNPAVLKKERFSEEVRELLLELKWWDLDIDKIEEIIPHLNSGNIQELKKLIKKV
ncbi:CatB-related O-acetyltransferase [Mesoplasma photuris]|uniref:CatB-related O-acetyltransferase n=1 Tax=Mesoplasma photuris TaxID=217731 RepID=UPI0004E25F16|nr:CatB-related O-acetyltransferase [Mesoplasma photuris]